MERKSGKRRPAWGPGVSVGSEKADRKRGLATDERSTLEASTLAVVGDIGFHQTTEAIICRHAGLPEQAFRRQFEGMGQAYLVAFEFAVADLGHRVLTAFGTELQWRDGVCAGLAELLGCLAAEPEFARACFAEGWRSGLVRGDIYEWAIRTVVPFYRGDLHADAPGALANASEITKDGLRGGITSLISRRLAAGDISSLESLQRDLEFFALTPFDQPI